MLRVEADTSPARGWQVCIGMGGRNAPEYAKGPILGGCMVSGKEGRKRASLEYICSSGRSMKTLVSYKKSSTGVALKKTGS